MNSLKSCWYRLVFMWKTRNMDPHQQLQFAQDEFQSVRNDLHEQFKNEPETRALMEAFIEIDRMAEQGLIAK